MMDLAEAYALVIADLKNRAKVDALRKEAAGLLSRQNLEQAMDEAVEELRSKSADEFKYVSALLRDAAEDILTENGGPVASDDILRRLEAGGYSGATRQTLHACLSRLVKSGKVVTVSKNVWDLASRYPDLASQSPDRETASVSSEVR